MLLPRRILLTTVGLHLYASVISPSLPRPHQILQSLHHQHCADTSVGCSSLLQSLNKHTERHISSLYTLKASYMKKDESSCYSLESTYQMISHHTRIFKIHRYPSFHRIFLLRQNLLLQYSWAYKTAVAPGFLLSSLLRTWTILHEFSTSCMLYQDSNCCHH